MADKEHQPVRRGAYGRGRSGHNRFYHHLGVRDLREIIDRKRSERGETSDSNPPPDSSYNYVKDPLRENVENSQETPRHSYTRKFKHNNPENKWQKDNEQRDSQITDQSKKKDIENPLNIKVEFSTSTGEHVYTVDESTVLPKIKHVPDHVPPHNRSYRGRGRGRGRGQRNYQTRTIRSSKQTPRNEEPQELTVTQGHPVEEGWDDESNESAEVNEHQVDDEQPGEDGAVDGEHLEGTCEQPECDLDKQIENLQLNENENLPNKENEEQ